MFHVYVLCIRIHALLLLSQLQTCLHACIRCLDYELCVRGGADLLIGPFSEFFLSPDSDNLESLEMQVFRESSGLSDSKSQSHPCQSVQGRLQEHSDFWLNELESSSFVQTIVTQGYTLPFTRLPDPVFLLNHNSALDNASFVHTAIEELVAGRCVMESSTCPLVCSPLSVVFNAKGKPRLVVDLRYINQFLPERKFKYEGLNLVPSLFSSGDFFTTFDLKSGYHHVDIHQDSWPYLGFSWGIGCTRKWYTFRVLPFGLSTACYVFTKLLRPLVKRWRSQGLRCVVYIDDGICAANCREQCASDTQQVVSDLGSAGFVINMEKSSLEPKQAGNWLGFTLDLQEGMFYVPKEKLSKLKTDVKSVLHYEYVGARKLASLVGQIISMSLAIGPVARLRTRSLYHILNSRRSWSSMVYITSAARDELRFWHSSLPAYNGQPIWFSPGATRVVFSDASSTGYGGFSHCVQVGPEIAHGQWSEFEASLSSTWRELKAVALVLSSLVTKLAGHRVKWFTDNQNVVRIVQTGSTKKHLQTVAMTIFETCFEFGIRLDMEWIPRTLNDKADYISRIQDLDDWQVSPVVFANIDSLWGPHSVDCFADIDNTQLPIFYSRFWCPGAAAVDAFTVNWSGDVNWLVPPFHLIARTVKHAQECKAVGSLLVPMWKSAYFWPILCPDGCHFAPFVHDCMFMHYMSGMFLPGKSGSNIGDSLTNDSIILALWLDFTVAPREQNEGFCT